VLGATAGRSWLEKWVFVDVGALTRGSRCVKNTPNCVEQPISQECSWEGLDLKIECGALPKDTA
jgi:hypothetical protein